MPKRKHSVGTQTSNCDEGTSITAKRYRAHQAYRAQQRSLLTRMAPGGGQTEFEARYHQHDILGRGGFGSVYAGVRKADHLPVAIKHILKMDVEFIPVISQGQLYHIPKEVFLMVKAVGGSERLGQSASVTLIEWFDLNNEILLVMERPAPSMDLVAFSLVYYPLPEDIVKEIIKQLVLALTDLHSRGIFHRDMKPENILIQDVPDGLRVRIIDFGCGCNITSYPYNWYSGTLTFAPPELFLEQRYTDIPTSVWQLGAIIFELIKNETDKEFTTSEFVCGNLGLTSCMSEECMDFLTACLEVNPRKRITLDQMPQHPWLQEPTAAY